MFLLYAFSILKFPIFNRIYWQLHYCKAQKKSRKKEEKWKKNPFIVFKQAWKLRQRLQSSGGKCTSLKLWQLNGWGSIEGSTRIVWKYQSKAIVCWKKMQLALFLSFSQCYQLTSISFFLLVSFYPTVL